MHSVSILPPQPTPSTPTTTITHSNPPQYVQDPYANYVVQRALTVTSGDLHMQLVDAIRPYLPTLRGTPHGKRILAKINMKL